MKYKIVIGEGCTAFYTKINDKRVEDLSKEEFGEFLDYMCQKLKLGIGDSTVSLDSFIRCFQYSDYESDEGYCEQCGDSTSRTIWEI